MEFPLVPNAEQIQQTDKTARDRHGDGRLPWKQSEYSDKSKDEEHRVADLSGQVGQNLDVEG